MRIMFLANEENRKYETLEIIDIGFDANIDTKDREKSGLFIVDTDNRCIERRL